jgi:hypothetical protein
MYRLYRSPPQVPRNNLSPEAKWEDLEQEKLHIFKNYYFNSSSTVKKLLDLEKESYMYL